LALRQRENWSEVHRMEIKQTKLDITLNNLAGLSAEELQLVRKIQKNHLPTKELDTTDTDFTEDAGNA